MKFTHYLLKNLIPEWIKLYINFQYLKTHLSTATYVKKILRKAKKHNIQYKRLKSEIVDNFEIIQKLVRDCNAYAEIFDDECEKIISFSQWKYKELLTHLDLLTQQFHIMNSLEHKTKQTHVTITWNLPITHKQQEDKRMELSQFTQQKQGLLDTSYKFYIECQQLKEYVQINSEGIRKILKKYKKQELRGIRNQKAEAEHFGRVQSLRKELSRCVKKIESIMLDVENLMINCYYRENPSQCRMNLRRYTQKTELKPCHIYLFGFFCGSAIVFILIIFGMRYDGLLDPNSDKVFNKIFPCFRGMALFLTYYWFISFDLAAWNYFRIDYKLYLGFNYHFSTVAEVWQRVAIFTAIYLIIFVWYCISVEESLGQLSKALHIVDVRYLPLIIWTIMTIYVFYPTKKYFNPQGRNWMYRMFKGALWGHFVKYESRYTFFTDQFTSMITGMRDLDYTICYYKHLIFLGMEHNGECRFNKRYTAASASVIPYMLKCIQYITRARDKGKYLWTDEMYNFIKTFIAMSVGIMSFAVRLDRSYLMHWIILAVICSCYENWWDIKKDFLLFESGTRYKFLRNDLGYNNPSIYYALVVVNFFLRIAWVLTISPDMYRILGINNELFILAFGFLEMSRRLVNNFLKMEKEHITNLRNLKTVQELKFPFVNQSIELINIEQDPYSRSISPLFNADINSPPISRKLSLENLLQLPLLEEWQPKKSHIDLASIPKNISFHEYLASRLTHKNLNSFRLTQMLDEPKETVQNFGLTQIQNADIVNKAQKEEKLQATKLASLKKENKLFKRILRDISRKYGLD